MELSFQSGLNMDPLIFPVSLPHTGAEATELKTHTPLGSGSSDPVSAEPSDILFFGFKTVSPYSPRYLEVTTQLSLSLNP